MVGGFFIVGTPGQARLYRFDEQKLSDLQSIQNQVVYYYQQKQKLPASLSALNDPLSYFVVPKDSQTGEDYGYRATGVRTFELCAIFNMETRGIQAGASVPVPVGYQNGMGDNWQHGAGQMCFERPIDPYLFPPLKPALR